MANPPAMVDHQGTAPHLLCTTAEGTCELGGCTLIAMQVSTAAIMGLVSPSPALDIKLNARAGTAEPVRGEVRRGTVLAGVVPRPLHQRQN